MSGQITSDYLNKLKQLPPKEALECFVILEATPWKEDCQYYEHQTSGCQVYGSPNCNNCSNYVKGVVK